jgi:uncharacterized membrane protein YfcA
MDFIGTIILIIIMTLATMGGIGGGGVVVLLIRYTLFFDLKEAVALSGFSIFTCSVARFLLTWSKRHPEKKDCVALDYGLATVMMPTVLIGSFIGVFFNTMLPDIVILILLSLLLFYLSIQALTNGCKTYKKENKAREAAQQAQMNPDKSISLKKKTTRASRLFLATGNRYSKESNFSKQSKSKFKEN